MGDLPMKEPFIHEQNGKITSLNEARIQKFNYCPFNENIS